MQSHNKTFGRVHAELEVPTPDDAEQTSSCWLSVRVNGKEYTCSLQVLESFGGIIDIDTDNNVYPMSNDQIDKISNWAGALGY